MQEVLVTQLLAPLAAGHSREQYSDRRGSGAFVTVVSTVLVCCKLKSVGPAPLVACFLQAQHTQCCLAQQDAHWLLSMPCATAACTLD